MRISDWSSDVFSSDLERDGFEIIFEVEPGVVGIELLEVDSVLPHLVALELGAGADEADEMVAARNLRVRPEDDRRAVIDAHLPDHAAAIGKASSTERLCQYV